MQEVFLRDDLAAAWAGRDPFDAAFALRGALARDVAARQTLQTEIMGRSYYVKRHEGVGWSEILKNWLTGKRPVLGAENEYRAALALAAAGIDTLPVAGFGQRGSNPAAMRSFLVTDDLSPARSLEDICMRWPEQPPAVTAKRALIRRVAQMAAGMHALGINHRDFYICHFLLRGCDGDTVDLIRGPLHLIDLHRAQIRSAVPRRWLVKDLGGLFFSAFDVGLTTRDVLRFVKAYFGVPLRQALTEQAELLDACDRRARALYEKAVDRRQLPRQVAGLPFTRSPFS